MERIIFWCEFPNKINWKKLNELLKKNNLKVNTYISCKNKKDFLQKKKFSSKNINILGAWPVLPKTRGYWFSGFTEKKDIDLLKEFKGINIKIDIEPPIPKKGSLNIWLTNYFLKRQKNKKYLHEVIKEISKKSNVILSTFPCPNFAVKRYGFFKDKSLTYNFMYYSTFIPKILRPLYRLYYRLFMLTKDKDKTYFALGLISKGIFNNEPVYKSVKEFRKDIKFLKKNKAKHFVIFRLGSLLERKNPNEWIKAIKEI
ncbi:MAG: hypothetical protein KKA65_01510 [Nanoarchaeota archaeon]|nr:hypothetical protein [Nanoarchaeota archaeon]MBU4456154.1 hypothetical protein [Nanoarchaeota archaeon]